MLGTAHSNNGINIVSLTFTGDAVPTYPQTASTAFPTGGTAARPSIFYIDKDFANSRLMQANVAIEWEVDAQTRALTVTYLFVDGTESAALDRSQPRHARVADVHASPAPSDDAPVSLLRRPTGRSRTSRASIAFESTAESRYNGITFELNRRLANHLQFRAAYTLGKVEDTVPDATAVVPGNAGDDVKYASNPANFDADRTVGNNDQRHRFVLSGVYDTNGLADGLDGMRADAGEGLVVQRDPDRAVGPAVHGARRRRRSERRRQHAQRHRAGHRRAISSGCRRSSRFDPRIARDIPVGRGAGAADLGSVQPVQPRQHQRRRHDLLQRRRARR